MPQIDLEKKRKQLDREITFFHVKRARSLIRDALKTARAQKDSFFILYFNAQKCILSEHYFCALHLLDKALAIRPDDGCSYNDKALCWAEMGDYTRSLRCFNDGIHQDPDCAVLYHNKGWLLNFLERHHEAIICFRKTLELDESRPESLYSLADSYEHLGNKTTARKYFLLASKQVKNRCSYMVRNIKSRLITLDVR